MRARVQAIRAVELRKRYGDILAVDGVSIAVEAGEIFGLLGPNGAGKTTTVEMIEGLRRPDAGTVHVLGHDLRTEVAAVRQRIGVQLQTTALFPRLTVREVLELFRTFYAGATASADELIDLLDLTEKAGSLTRDLSGGRPTTHDRLPGAGDPGDGTDAARPVRDRGAAGAASGTAGPAPPRRHAAAAVGAAALATAAPADDRTGPGGDHRRRGPAGFGVEIGDRIGLLAAFCVLGALTFVSLGYLIAALSKTEESVFGITSVLNFPMMFLSGIFFPLEIMPDWIRPVVQAIPLTYLVDALRQTMVGAPPVHALGLDALVLGIWLAVAAVLSVRLFRWE